MPESQIVFENIIKTFGEAVAVEKMSFSIEQGEFLAIMGSSGCGKTTTLRMLAGLEIPSEGEIRLNGERINELAPAKRNTPLVWQSLALFPFLTVLENVEFGLKMHGIEKTERRERALKWLDRMEIGEFAERSIDQLSGGQRQRVALARALVTEPPVLLLDEPLSALDANLVVRMQGVLSKLQKELGITFVYVTHSQSEAFAMADRVVIMSKGLIEQIGTPQQVFREPATRFVAEFVGSNNIISGKVSSKHSDVHRTDLFQGVPYTVDTDLGEVVISSGELDLGATVELVISSDRMDISFDPSDLENQFPCKLVSEEFVGSIVTLLVETENGMELKIQKQHKDIENIQLQTGQALWVSWERKSAYIIPGR